MNKALLTAALFGISASLLTPGETLADPHETAVLQGLDKVTARITTIDARIGEVVRFGTLEIIARHCDKKPPEETPESAAFLDVWEVRPGEAAADIFRGWMFASSPGINPLEHPVYDVWVKDCKDKLSISDESLSEENTPSPNADGN